MPNSRVYHLVCDFCDEEFQAPSKKKHCSKECQKRSRQEQHEELVRYRQSLTNTCEECGRVFTWEDKKDVTESAFIHMICCSSACHRIYQEKETTERNSIVYHGVKLTIEDVCALEQKSLQTIHALMRKKALPGAKWADPKRRKAMTKQRSTWVRVRRDQIVAVRLTKEHLEELQGAAKKSGAGLNDWAAGKLLECARQETRKVNPC
jgi:predicted HicB family RNase H-like nuclease